MAPTLYYMQMSAPSRSVLLTAKAIGLNLNLEIVNLLQGEQMKQEVVNLNPLHTIPILVDDEDFVVWDSHAIMAFLIGELARDESLYPKDSRQRYIIDQMLHFESSRLAPLLRKASRNFFVEKKKEVPPELIEEIKEAFSDLQTILSTRQYAAGDEASIADLSLVTTVSNLNVFVPVSGYPKIDAWIKKLKSFPSFDEVNSKGADSFEKAVKAVQEA